MLEAKIPKLEETSAELAPLDAVVQKGLAYSPESRFATAREMAAALERTVPPATDSEVGEWIERIAGPVLARRAKAVADIERASPAAPEESEPVSTPAPTSEAPMERSVVVLTRPAPLPRTSHVRLVGVAAATLAVAVAALLFVMKPSGGAAEVITPSTRVAVTTATETATAPPSPEPSPPPPAAVASAPAVEPATPVVTPSALPMPAAHPAMRVERAAAARPPKPAAPRALESAQAAVRPVADCSPPYTFDALGRKHYKADCL